MTRTPTEPRGGGAQDGTAFAVLDAFLEGDAAFSARALDRFPDAVVISTLDATIVRASRAAAHLMGERDVDAMRGANSWQYFRKPAQVQKRRSNLDRLHRDGRYGLVEYEVSRRDGTTISVEASSARLDDDRGRAIGFLVIARDATDKRRAMEALAASESRFREVVEAFPGIVFQGNAELRPLYMAGCEKVTGYTADELFGDGRTWLEVIHGDDKEGVRRNVSAMLETRQPQTTLYRITDAAGEVRWVEERVVPILADDGSVDHVDGVILDVTEREVGRIHLRDLTDRLAETEERERREIAADLHDGVGQTLQALKMELDAAVAAGPGQMPGDWERIEHLWARAMEECRGLTTRLSPTVLHDLGLVPALRVLQRDLRRDHGFELDLHVDACAPTLAALSGHVRLSVYRSLREMVVNVAKHAEVDSARVSGELDGGWLLLTVADEGVGFDAAGSGSSSGFGLLSVRERARTLGGDLILSSAPGEGCRVTLRLPADARNGRNGAA